jgi:threonine dehydratase
VQGDDVDIALVEEVRPVVARHTRRTPLLRSEWLSALAGGQVYLKCENLQVTGAFKVRGAFATLARLSEGERRAGVVACSAGNHGQGLALAARTFGVRATVVVPASVPRVKEEGIRALGARLLKSPYPGYDDTQSWTLERLAELGGVFVSPFEGAGVIAGNGGTLALEILEDQPDLDAIVVPCGGGGCAIGLGVVARARSPRTRILGVNTDASPGMWLSRRDGRAHLRVESEPTIADGIEGGVSERSFRLAERFVDEVVVVQEATVRRAVAEIALREHLIVEGAGAAGVAALLDGRVQAPRIAVVLTGSNIDGARLVELLREAES